MKKMIKMSLVAAVAVAGLTSTASAKQNMAEWAKNTTLSGYVRYRLNTAHDDGTGNSADTNEETKAVMKFTTPVNDMVTANLKYVSFADTSKGHTTADTAAYEGNFVVKAGASTVIAGLQTTQSPFAANNGDTRSHGVTALIPAGSATIAAAHYTTTVNGAAVLNEVTALGAIVKAGAANVEAWYASAADKEDAHIALLANTDMSGLKIGLAYATGDEDQSNMKLTVSGKAGAIAYLVGYGTSGEAGSATLDGDTDGKLALTTTSAKISTANTSNSSVMVADVSMPAGPVNLGLQVLSGSTGATDADLTSTSIRVSKNLSKNFKLAAWYATETIGDADHANSRICAKYTF